MLKKRMRKKGWSSKDLKHLDKKTEEVRKKRDSAYYLIEMFLYWFVLVFAILCSLIISFVLIFFFVLLKPIGVYVLTGIIGVMFGMLFEVLLRNIDWIETKHHFFGGVILAAIVLLNLMIFSSAFTERVILFSLVRIPAYGNLIIGTVYCISFFVPFVIHKVTSKRFY